MPTFTQQCLGMFDFLELGPDYLLRVVSLLDMCNVARQTDRQTDRRNHVVLLLTGWW